MRCCRKTCTGIATFRRPRTGRAYPCWGRWDAVNRRSLSGWKCWTPSRRNTRNSRTWVMCVFVLGGWWRAWLFTSNETEDQMQRALCACHPAYAHNGKRLQRKSQACVRSACIAALTVSATLNRCLNSLCLPIRCDLQMRFSPSACFRWEREHQAHECYQIHLVDVRLSGIASLAQSGRSVRHRRAHLPQCTAPQELKLRVEHSDTARPTMLV